jgi:hypothetical protein
LPPLDSKLWPQAPLLFRPQPNSGTKIIGIRKDASSDYLWKPNEKTPWWHVLQEQWGSKATGPALHPCCEYCAILPINNGQEAEGESLVADFETALFHGSLMIRLCHSEGTDDTKGFFAGKSFRYQAIIHGRYQTDLPYTELVGDWNPSRASLWQTTTQVGDVDGAQSGELLCTTIEDET